MKLFTAIAVIACLMIFPSANADDEATAEHLESGKAIAFDRNKGNCLACHVIEGGEFPGNSGPPLLLMKIRYPDKADLRAQVWDAGANDPATRMPPYGRHRILTEAEIDLVVDFIYSL
jgi:sulfur-oxidizing protein SoxX